MSQASGDAVPSLQEFLSQPKKGPCIYVRSTTPEQRQAIDEVVARGETKWSAFARWLKAQNVDVGQDAIGAHYRRGHDADA